jgi:hypothetical protein
VITRANVFAWMLRHWPRLGRWHGERLQRRYEAARARHRGRHPIVPSLDKDDAPLLTIEQIKRSG